MHNLKDIFYKDGYLYLKNFFDKTEIDKIYSDATNIYKIQMINLKIIKNQEEVENNVEFENCMELLFNNYTDVFISCGKQCQHLISLWKLSLDEKIIDLLKKIGINSPIISTRPVLFSNSKKISKSAINHTVPPHQDYSSMQGSINSVVIWVPLIDISKELGSISIIPKSHFNGLVFFKKEEGFGVISNIKEDDFISFDVYKGDIILFSSFLIHKSGNNNKNNIRWSTHFRYNDLNDNSFIQRGYPHAYIYKPVDEELTKNFDTKKCVNTYYGSI